MEKEPRRGFFRRNFSSPIERNLTVRLSPASPKVPTFARRFSRRAEAPVAAINNVSGYRGIIARRLRINRRGPSQSRISLCPFRPGASRLILFQLHPRLLPDLIPFRISRRGLENYPHTLARARSDRVSLVDDRSESDLPLA